MASLPLQNPGRWTYTWEALAHIPTLRLFLFYLGVDPSIHCGGVKAVLVPGQYQLLVTWVDGEGEGKDITLMVPVPRVLIDPAFSVSLATREDHIEVKLGLLLPVDHPIIATFCSGPELSGGKWEDESLPLSLDSDLKPLSAGDVHFYCKSCSTRLTKKNLRNFVELPSANWREVADNWFGTCCCSFGGISEKLVARYLVSHSSVKGRCLVDPISIIISKDDLKGYAFTDKVNEPVENDDDVFLSYAGDLNAAAEIYSSLQEVNTCTTERKDKIYENQCHTTQTNSPTCDNGSSSSSSYLAFSSCSAKSGATTLSVNCSDTCNLSMPEIQSACDVDSNSEPYLCCGNFEKPFSEPLASEIACNEFQHCRINGGSWSISQKSQNVSNSGPIGNGFITRTSTFSNNIKWHEFLCVNCSTLIGSYPSSVDTDAPLDGGIRLFKCYVSSSIPVGGPDDLFRKHTLQKVFINLLLESAADELSFQTIVRDMSTKFPMLKVIVVNPKVWCYTGHCFENEAVGLSDNIHLRPFVKVLFSDYSISVEADSRELDEWSTKSNVDEFYMMARQIKSITKILKSSLDRLPISCSILQSMSLSYIER